jgi:hypothetical protein
MIYLKREKLEKIGKYLSIMGEKIGKNEWKDILELRTSIIGTINTLSDDINLGGQIIEDIMDEHDKIVFPLIFKNTILEMVNEALPTGTVLETGKFEILKEGRYQSFGECLCYDFIKYKGCRIVIYDFCEVVWFLLIVDPIYKEFNDFRQSLAAIGTYNQRIKLEKIDLLNPIPSDKNKDSAPLIKFSDRKDKKEDFTFNDSMEIYRTTNRGFANELAIRIKYYYYETKISGTDFGIEEFLDKYYINQIEK